MMKIQLVVEPGCDGVFRHVETLARYCMAEGHSVALAYSSVRGSDRLWSLASDVEGAGGATVDLKISNAPQAGDLSALARLWAFTRRVQPDVIHTHSSKAGALGRVLPLLGVRSPILYTPNAYFGMQAVSGRRAAIFNSAEAVLGYYGKSIHVSQSEVRFARATLGLPSGRQTMIPNAVDCRRFRPAADVAVLRSRWGLPAGGIVLGTVARYSEQKDPRTLYQALRPLLAAQPRLWFFHVGQGELQAAITDMIRDWPEAARIVRVPYLEDTSEAYRAMDCFVLSSRYEGFAISALEAIASGLPLVLTRCSGNVDFENYGLNAVHWCEPGDGAGLTAAMAGALDGLNHVRCNHREVALAQFSEETVYGQILGCYKRLAARLAV